MSGSVLRTAATVTIVMFQASVAAADSVGGEPIFADGFETGNTLRWQCVNLQCFQLDCPGPVETSVSGTIFAPNGVTPLPNVTVYVPNAAVPALPEGAQCSRCGDPLPGSAIAQATTAVDGTFTLSNMPATSNVPVVVQIGKWRRQLVVAGVPACADTPLLPEDTRLPKNQDEGDLPRIAVSTGAADARECTLRKVGIDDTEFSIGGGGGRVHLYAGTGTDAFDGAHGGQSFSPSTGLWAASTVLDDYDLVVLSCESSQNVGTKPPTALSAMKAYADLGGRIFASHWHNYWLQAGPAPWPTVVSFNNALADLGAATWDVNQVFDRGADFAAWLVEVDLSVSQGTLPLPGTDHSATAVSSSASAWISRATTANGVPSIQYLSFTTPVESPPADRCGRVLFTDLEQGIGDNSNSMLAFPSGGCVTPVDSLTATEKIFVWELFDLGGCSGPSTE